MEEIKRNARWKILDTRSKDANFRDQGSILLLKREGQRESFDFTR